MNLQKTIFSTLLASILTLSVSFFGHAEQTIPPPPPPVPGETDPGSVISPLKKGQIAPFTGVLLSPQAVATVTVELNSTQERLKIELDRVKSEETAKCDFRVAEVKTNAEADVKVLLAQLEASNTVSNVISERLKKEEEDRPNLSLWVGVGTGMGFVVGVATTILITYSANQASK